MPYTLSSAKFLLLFIKLIFCLFYFQLTLGQTPAQESFTNSDDEVRNVNNYIDDFPSHWSLSFVREPVFHSDILVAEIGGPAKPPIILIHGLGQSGMRDWLTVVPALEDNYRILTLDLPGFGGSFGAEGRFSPTNYAKVIAFIRERFLGTEKIIVIGHSMGGAVALRYSSDYSDSVERTILVDAAGILDRTAFLKQNTILRFDLSQASGKLKGFVSGVNDFTGGFVELVNAFPDPTKLVRGEGTWSTVFANKPNLNAGLALVEEDFSAAVNNHRIDTYMIWGGEDGVAPLRTAKALEKQLASAELKIIPDAGHVPMASHTQIFNDLLNSMLAQSNPNSRPPMTTAGSDNLKCKNDNGHVFQGSYKHIQIVNCSAITLKNVGAERLEIIDSVVELENVSISSDRTSVILEDSVLLGTGVYIKGSTAFKADGSRIDLAGATLIGTKEAFRIKDSTKLVFSISKLASPIYTGSLHGSYTAEDDIFDKKLH